MSSGQIHPFKIEVSEDAISDLKSRLENTLWPGEVKNSDWNYGTDLSYLKELVTYWQNEFDWRAQEQLLNRYPQFKTDVDGTTIHFWHVKGKGLSPKPLVLTHGWPSMFFEFHKLVEPLSDPANHGGNTEDAFDVIIPSLPGYGFTQISDEPGMNPMRMAELWAGLMTKLGYDQFFLHGGDWGSFVSALVAYLFPQRVLGLHVTMMSVAPPPSSAPKQTPTEIDEAKAAKRKERAKWAARETGYSAIQSTKPQTLAYGLTDSPTGLAAWIIEKWRRWTDCGGDVEKVYTKDELLTIVSIYWFTQTINSSMRLYYENAQDTFRLKSGEQISVPTSFALFPAENIPLREKAEKAYNVVRWTKMPKGGHFPAMEVPDLLIEDLREACRPYR